MIPGEASPNPVEFRFSLTTRLPSTPQNDKQGSLFRIVAPLGFKFPRVCRFFATDINNPDFSPIPLATLCTGTSDPTLPGQSVEEKIENLNRKP